MIPHSGGSFEDGDFNAAGLPSKARPDGGGVLSEAGDARGEPPRHSGDGAGDGSSSGSGSSSGGGDGQEDSVWSAGVKRGREKIVGLITCQVGQATG